MMKSEPKNAVQNVLNFQQTECPKQIDSYRYLISSNSTQFSTRPLSQTFWLILQIFHVLLFLWYLAAFTLHHALWHSDRFLCSNQHYGLLFVSNHPHCGVSHWLFPSWNFVIQAGKLLMVIVLDPRSLKQTQESFWVLHSKHQHL